MTHCPNIRHRQATRGRWRFVIPWLLCLAATAGCNTLGYAGDATQLSATNLREEPGWLAVKGVPVLRQENELDCGLTALEMVLRFHGLQLPAHAADQRLAHGRWSAGELREVAREQGLQAFIVEGSVDDLVHELEAGRPVVVGTSKPTVTGESVAHYEVVVGLNRESKRVATVDPAAGMRQNTFQGFLQEWLPTGSVLLVVIPAATEAASETQARGTVADSTLSAGDR